MENSILWWLGCLLVCAASNGLLVQKFALSILWSCLGNTIAETMS